MKRIALFTGLALALGAPAFAQDTSQETTPPTSSPTPTESEENTGMQETTGMEDMAEAQDTAQAQEPSKVKETSKAQGGTMQSATGQSATVRRGRLTRGVHEGDPPMIDHRADTLIVEPPVSTITIVPTPGGASD